MKLDNEKEFSTKTYCYLCQLDSIHFPSLSFDRLFEYETESRLHCDYVAVAEKEGVARLVVSPNENIIHAGPICRPQIFAIIHRLYPIAIFILDSVNAKVIIRDYFRVDVHAAAAACESGEAMGR